MRVTEPQSLAAEEFIKHFKHGPLIGTFTYNSVYTQKEAVGDIYFLNDLEVVGVRHADNSKMLPGRGWLTWRGAEIQANYARYRAEYCKQAGIKDPDLVKQEMEAKKVSTELPKSGGLKLKIKGKPVLQPKSSVADSADSIPATKPTLSLKLKTVLPAKPALKPKPQFKPKFKSK